MVLGGSVSLLSRMELCFLRAGDAGGYYMLYFLSISLQTPIAEVTTFEKLFLVRETLGYRMLYFRVVFTWTKFFSRVSDFDKTHDLLGRVGKSKSCTFGSLVSVGEPPPNFLLNRLLLFLSNVELLVDPRSCVRVFAEPSVGVNLSLYCILVW